MKDPCIKSMEVDLESHQQQVVIGIKPGRNK